MAGQKNLGQGRVDLADLARLSYHNFQWDETVNVARIQLDGTVDEVIAASQPVLPILVISRRRWLPGRTLSMPMWIVNDLHRSFTNVHVTATLTFIGSR